ncbi:MAG: DM13 domain-containing protein [Candidatus Nitrosotenuis sp.]
MLRAVTISIVIGTFLIGMYYVVEATYVQPQQQSNLTEALDKLSVGLTYDKLVSLEEEERYSLVRSAPSETVRLIMQEAQNHPSFVAESKDKIKEHSGSAELRLVKLTPIAGLKGFEAHGTAGVFVSGDSTFLRLENFDVTPGLDQYLYLTKDGSVASGIELGRLKATEGSHNYDITGMDMETFNILIIYSPTFDTYYAHARFLKAE